jgi:hypothetical protein
MDSFTDYLHRRYCRISFLLSSGAALTWFDADRLIDLSPILSHRFVVSSPWRAGGLVSRLRDLMRHRVSRRGPGRDHCDRCGDPAGLWGGPL